MTFELRDLRATAAMRTTVWMSRDEDVELDMGGRERRSGPWASGEKCPAENCLKLAKLLSQT
ncbi:MAG: hypothetical protein K1X36_01750 [Pyrinomonadaceae bacterium]|nr:hypothetical protein [Pyrinomonadaceae bacterium]